MIPQGKEKENVVVVCTRCGYKEVIKQEEASTYVVVEQKPEEERTITTLKVSEARRKPPKSLEEWEQEREEYREVLQELLQEETSTEE